MLFSILHAVDLLKSFFFIINLVLTISHAVIATYFLTKAFIKDSNVQELVEMIGFFHRNSLRKERKLVQQI